MAEGFDGLSDVEESSIAEAVTFLGTLDYYRKRIHSVAYDGKNIFEKAIAKLYMWQALRVCYKLVTVESNKRYEKIKNRFTNKMAKIARTGIY